MSGISHQHILGSFGEGVVFDVAGDKGIGAGAGGGGDKSGA